MEKTHTCEGYRMTDSPEAEGVWRWSSQDCLFSGMCFLGRQFEAQNERLHIAVALY